MAFTDMAGESILSKAISKQPSGRALELLRADFVGWKSHDRELRKALFHFGAELRKSKEVVMLLQLKALNGRTGFRAKAHVGVLPVNCGLRCRGSQGCGCNPPVMPQ